MTKPKRTIVLVVVSGVLLVLLSISRVFPMLVCMLPVTLPPPTVPDYPNGQLAPSSLRDTPQRQYDVLVTPDPPEVVLRWYQEQLHGVRGWEDGHDHYVALDPYAIGYTGEAYDTYRAPMLALRYRTDAKDRYDRTSYLFAIRQPTLERGLYRYTREFIDESKIPRDDVAGYRPTYDEGTGMAPWCPVDTTPRQWWKE